jgi:hypothetical protein
MVDDTRGTRPFSLRRWSQRKLAAGREDASQRDDGARSDNAPAATPVSAVPGTSPVPGAAPAAVAAATLPQSREAAASSIPLPPLESLTIDSDYSPFMQPGVDENVKRSALRKLLRHPRFNVMDGLDVYIDDYSLPSPIEPALVRTLMQARYIFNPPQTRVNAEGHVEDVPDEPAEAADAGAAPVPQVAEAADAADARLPGDEIAAAIVEAPAETSTPGDASNDAGLPNPAAAQTQTKAIR